MTWLRDNNTHLNKPKKDKEWGCHGCGDEVVVVELDYEEQYCCSGAPNQCGCMGAPTNPVFCEKCESQLFKSTI